LDVPKHNSLNSNSRVSAEPDVGADNQIRTSGHNKKEAGAHKHDQQDIQEIGDKRIL
jgi:hypothetical protein